MKKSAKKGVLFLTFDDALKRACGDGDQTAWDLSREFFLDQPDYKQWVSEFAQRHRATLERLYTRHGVPPAAILGLIGMVEFSDVPKTAPSVTRSKELLEQAAQALEASAQYLETLDTLGPLYDATPLRSTPQFRDELRRKAAAIRERKSVKHRPRDVQFTECALYLTELFLRYARLPLYDHTAALILDHRVNNRFDSVKKTVLAALKRNPRGSIEKRVAALNRS